MPVTESEVIWAFRMILGRDPENWGVITNHMRARNVAELRRTLLMSNEFASKAQALRFEEKWVCADIYDRELRLWLDLGDYFVSVPCLQDKYEPLETNFIKANLKQGQRACDIGANIGWHTLGMARAVGVNGHVFSFEPRTPTVNYLRRSIEENKLGYCVTVSNLGLWDTDAAGFLNWPEGSVNPGSSYLSMISGPMSKMRIELRPLDSFGLPKIDLIKIDIEGAEARALRGAERVITASKPIILSELYPEQLQKVSGTSPADFIGAIKALGYDCWLLERGRVGEAVDNFPSNLARELTNIVFMPSGREAVW